MDVQFQIFSVNLWTIYHRTHIEKSFHPVKIMLLLVKVQTAKKKKHFTGLIFSPFWVDPVFPVGAELNVGVSVWQIKKQGS